MMSSAGNARPGEVMTSTRWTAVATLGSWLLSGILMISIADGLDNSREVSAATGDGLPDIDELLIRYDQAVRELPRLPNLQYRQQVRVEGSQEFTATIDVLQRQDGSWQAWLAQGDRIRLIDSEDLNVVSQANLLELYSVYVTDPASLIPEVGFNLRAPEQRYEVASVESKAIVSPAAPQDPPHPVIHLVLEPKSEDQGQLRELWLDPDTTLPRQALLYLQGVWGKAYVLMNFEEIDDYWLPTHAAINLGYGFWTLEGLSRRVFRGSLSIRHEYQDYQILPDGETLRFQSSRPPVDRPPTVAGLPSESTISSGDIEFLGTEEDGNRQFSVGLRNQSSNSVLEEEITAFNLTRPASRDALTQIDILASLGLGSRPLPVYLFQFDTDRPLSPLQPANNSSKVDPKDVFVQPPTAIKLFGN